jgi:exodeoxyribonuclease VII small subunit
MNRTTCHEKPPPMTEKEFALERAIERIKEIQQRLQDGQASFDQSLQLFQEADGLIKRSQDYLQRAELRLRILGDEDKEA